MKRPIDRFFDALIAHERIAFRVAAFALALVCWIVLFVDAGLHPWSLLRALGFDWDEILMICTAFGALAYVIMEWRRVSRLDEYALAFEQRLAELEGRTGAHNPISLAERVAAVEAERATFDPAEVRATLASHEARLDIVERLATVEARLDHKPVTQTRAKGGKFASPSALQDEIDRLRAELAKRGVET